MFHVSTEAEKAQDLQLASWTPRRANVRCKFSLNAGGPETQREPSFHFKSEGGRRMTSQLRGSQRRCSLLLIGGPGCLLYLGLPRIRWGPPPFGGNLLSSVCPFPCSSHQELSRTHLDCVRPNVWAARGSVKLMHEMNSNSILCMWWINSSPMILDGFCINSHLILPCSVVQWGTPVEKAQFRRNKGTREVKWQYKETIRRSQSAGHSTQKMSLFFLNHANAYMVKETI